MVVGLLAPARLLDYAENFVVFYRETQKIIGLVLRQAQANLGKNGGMEKYIVTLKAEEIDQLRAFVVKGRHSAQKVINALILLNCNKPQGHQGRRTNLEIAQMLQVSDRKIERVKRRFVEEGLEVVLNGQAPQREYVGKIDGDMEARLVAMSCSAPAHGPCALVAAPAGRSDGGTRLGGGHLARERAPDT